MWAGTCVAKGAETPWGKNAGRFLAVPEKRLFHPFISSGLAPLSFSPINDWLPFFYVQSESPTQKAVSQLGSYLENIRQIVRQDDNIQSAKEKPVTLLIY